MGKFVFFTLLLISTLSAAVTAQSDSSTAAVNWERYKIGDRKISIMLPKMPTVISRTDLCHETARSTYYAYADGVVYELVVSAKARGGIPAYCRDKVSFGENAFLDRLNELRNGRVPDMESSEQRYERQTYKFTGTDQSRWVFADLKQNRWFELAIYSRSDGKIDESRFVDSLDLSGGEGKEIGDGSPATLGDADLMTQPVPATSGTPNTTEAVRIIAKPNPSYTELARKNRVQGTVRLKITLSANGAVGNIETVSGLEAGLTEQAIAVARKVVFLPHRANGVPVNVVKTFEYNFNIY